MVNAYICQAPTIRWRVSWNTLYKRIHYNTKTDINEIAIKHFLYKLHFTTPVPSVKAVLKPTQSIYGIREWAYPKHHMKKYETMNGTFAENLKI